MVGIKKLLKVHNLVSPSELDCWPLPPPSLAATDCETTEQATTAQPSGLARRTAQHPTQGTPGGHGESK